MSRDRRDEDDPSEDAPDWFDAGVTEEVATTSGTDERDRLDDDEVGDWFTDPDHQPVGPGVASADATVDEPAAPDTEGERTVVDEIAATLGSADASPSVDGERSETVAPEFDSSPGEPMPDSSGVSTAAEGTAGTTGPEPASSTSEPAPEPDEAGSVDDATDAATRPATEERGTGPAERAGRDDTDGTGSPVQRFVAWLRSVFGR